jgi:hypothetical protein
VVAREIEERIGELLLDVVVMCEEKNEEKNCY